MQAVGRGHGYQAEGTASTRGKAQSTSHDTLAFPCPGPLSKMGSGTWHSWGGDQVTRASQGEVWAAREGAEHGRAEREQSGGSLQRPLWLSLPCWAVLRGSSGNWFAPLPAGLGPQGAQPETPTWPHLPAQPRFPRTLLPQRPPWSKHGTRLQLLPSSPRRAAHPQALPLPCLAGPGHPWGLRHTATR